MELQLTYLIVDDEELSRWAVQQEAVKYPFLKSIGSYQGASDALAAINNKAPDILFSDIEMPGMTGVDMMRQLLGKVPVPIFITSHPDYAVESFELEIFDYLLKPIDALRFEKCMARVQEFFALHKKAMPLDNSPAGHDYILIKQGYDKYKVPFDDILFLEAMKDYTKIKTDKNQTFLVLETIGGLLQQLPADRFQRIHRSYVLNKDKITHFTSARVWVKEQELPIGKSYRSLPANWQ